MLDTIFTGLFEGKTTINAVDFMICLATAIGIGLLIALVYSFRNKPSKGFLVTLAMLPAVVAAVIMMVNGNIGAGVAVAGAFSLVRFRSVPGSAREICAIFLAMAAGLTIGMGFLAYGLLFVLILGIADMVLNGSRFGERKDICVDKVMRITIPEDLDYGDVFEDIFEQYTNRHKLAVVKTTDLGSLFKLTYQITLKDPKKEKEMIDKLRCRNGNLEITSSIRDNTITEL